jgi:carboxymethylenebutenolidase
MPAGDFFGDMMNGAGGPYDVGAAPNLSGGPMERKTAHDFDQELLILFDAYVHGALDRRGFLDKAAKFAVGGVTAAMLLDQLSPKFAEAQVVKPDDTHLKAEHVEYDSPSGNGKMRGYLAQPAKAKGKPPAVLVIHENRGLNPHIEDIARRLALDDFVAFAPDALFPLGGYPGTEDKARELFPKLDQAKTREDFVAAFHWLKARKETSGKVGAVGFCYGGGMVNFLATRLPDLAAGVPFYGSAPNLEDVPRIKAALLIQSAEVDERINAAWPAYEAALKAAGVRYERYQYPGTQHGFNNDTTPRFDAAAAKLAWERTLAHLNKHLR